MSMAVLHPCREDRHWQYASQLVQRDGSGPLARSALQRLDAMYESGRDPVAGIGGEQFSPQGKALLRQLRFNGTSAGGSRADGLLFLPRGEVHHRVGPSL